MSILFISAGSIANNPRLYKEVFLAHSQGMKVGCVCCDYDGWSASIEKQRYKELSEVNFSVAHFSRNYFLHWLTAAAAQGFCRKIRRFFPERIWINSVADDRRSLAVFLALPKERYDLVVAHSLAAFPAALSYAARHRIPCGFDVEDFHPGEGMLPDSEYGRVRAKLLQALLPHTAYFTYASPLIGEEVKRLLSQERLPRSEYIRNCFSREFFPYREPAFGGPIRLVWFSQTIGPGRGLEPLLSSTAKFSGGFEVTLIGAGQEAFCADLIARYGDFLRILPPLPEERLYPELCNHDIGLALEVSLSDFNRKICLTNKIFAYLQAGLFILATETPTQRDFLAGHPDCGILCNVDEAAIVAGLKFLLDNMDEIRRKKRFRHEASSAFCMEEENRKLLAVWKAVERIS